MAGFYALNIATQKWHCFCFRGLPEKPSLAQKENKKPQVKSRQKTPKNLLKLSSVTCAVVCSVEFVHYSLRTREELSVSGMLHSCWVSVLLCACPVPASFGSLSYVFCSLFDLQCELKEVKKTNNLKEIQWDNLESNFTGASFKTNSGLTLLYAVTLVYFCTYFV